ncbi:MAG: Exodeoxyribonuclease 7 small subunit [bacterium ADurb.Bin429]|nr:MAG: Exodeoxyribonuclease 7 small subunit [bacterium ADurb.Bin429]
MEETPYPDPRNFEEALARLEEIAATLERNDVPLDHALTLVTEAAHLKRYCRAQLTEAEGMLEKLVELADGEIRLDPLERE